MAEQFNARTRASLVLHDVAAGDDKQAETWLKYEMTHARRLEVVALLKRATLLAARVTGKELLGRAHDYVAFTRDSELEQESRRLESEWANLRLTLEDMTTQRRAVETLRAGGLDAVGTIEMLLLYGDFIEATDEFEGGENDGVSND